MNIPPLPRHVAKTRIGPAEVSTILCPIGTSDRSMAETMIFIDEGMTIQGIPNMDCERDMPELAMSQHERWCERVRAALEPTP